MDYCMPRKDNLNLENSRVCSIHFEEECFEIPLKHRLLEYSPSNYRILRADAVPTNNLPGVLLKKCDEGRLLRAAKRSTRMEVESILSAASTSQISQSQEDLECPEQVVGSQRVEEPELDVEYEVLPQLHTGSETEVSLLKKRIEELEIVNCEQAEKLKNQGPTIKQYKDAMDKLFTQSQLRKLFNPGMSFNNCQKKLNRKLSKITNKNQ